MSTVGKRRVAAVLGAALVAATLAACGESSGTSSGATGSQGTTPAASAAPSRTPSGAPTVGAPSSSTAPSSPASSASASGPATGTASGPASAAAAPACGNGQVKVRGRVLGAGMGHSGAVLVFTNTSGQACTLTGYPGVAGLDKAGNQVTQAERTLTGYLGHGYHVRPVRVPVGGHASALVEATSVPSGDATSCPTYAALLVTPPNTTASKKVGVSLPGCGGLTVHPVVRGTSGRTA